MAKYVVNEIFVAPQGEGVRVGILHVFVRFAFCDLTCSFCDTEFASGRPLSAEGILEECTRLAGSPVVDVPSVPHGARLTTERGPARAVLRNVLLTGGEPLLQVDGALVETFKTAGWFVALETNGRHAAPAGIDWISCSPKGAEHTMKLEQANELRYVRGRGQGIPRPAIVADHHLVSPVFEGAAPAPGAVETCLELIREHPAWRLSFQAHKMWGCR